MASQSDREERETRERRGRRDKKGWYGKVSYGNYPRYRCGMPAHATSSQLHLFDYQFLKFIEVYLSTYNRSSRQDKCPFSQATSFLSWIIGMRSRRGHGVSVSIGGSADSATGTWRMYGSTAAIEVPLEVPGWYSVTVPYQTLCIWYRKGPVDHGRSRAPEYFLLPTGRVVLTLVTEPTGTTPPTRHVGAGSIGMDSLIILFRPSYIGSCQSWRSTK